MKKNHRPLRERFLSREECIKVANTPIRGKPIGEFTGYRNPSFYELYNGVTAVYYGGKCSGK